MRQWAIGLLPVSFLTLLFFLPVFEILKEASSYSLSPVREILSSARFWEITWFTIWQSLVSTFLSITFAFPAIYLFTKYEFKGKKVLRSLITIPFVLPTVVVGSAFTAVFTLSLIHI